MEKKGFPFITTRLKPKVRILHYLLTRILLPRNINIDYVIKDNIVPLRYLAKNIPTNWVDGVFHHTSHSREKYLANLPYGAMIIKILRTFNIDNLIEKSISSSNKIDYTSLRNMNINIKYKEPMDDWEDEEEEAEEIEDIYIKKIWENFQNIAR